MAKKELWLSLPFHLSHEIDRLFEELIHRPWGAPLQRYPEDWQPELDLYETDDAFILEVDLPGVQEQDVTVHVEAGELVLTGQRICTQEKERRSMHRNERREGYFVRRLRLPTSVAPEHLDVTFHDGVLRVSLPKLAKERKSSR